MPLRVRGNCQLGSRGVRGGGCRGPGCGAWAWGRDSGRGEGAGDGASRRTEVRRESAR